MYCPQIKGANMRDAVIFDMDGLLLDTEQVALRTFTETCAHFGLSFDLELYHQCIGSNLQRTANILEKGIDGFSKEKFMPVWNAAYVENAVEKSVPIKTGVLDFLNMLRSSNVPCAIATSSPRRNATRKLENSGLSGYFSEFMFGDEVTDSKPHPEIYLKAAEKLEIDPKNCLALEDSDNGVRAAHGAGMFVFQVPDIVDPSADVLKLGHEIVPTVAHVHQRFIAKTKL